MAEQANHQIVCRVNNCKYHDKTKYCTRQGITVGQECYCATDKNQTDCTNFELEIK